MKSEQVGTLIGETILRTYYFIYALAFITYQSLHMVAHAIKTALIYGQKPLYAFPKSMEDAAGVLVQESGRYRWED